jgi:glyoxylase-like metal-dependent hydrolase (beta-lactamase superfamily II)
MPSLVETAVTELQIPPAMLGPEAVTSDVRCFVVPHADGAVLVDTGPPGNAATIEAVLSRAAASWSDVSDIVLTHSHLDHVGSLAEVVALARSATLWAGSHDAREIGRGVEAVTHPLADGDEVRDLTVVETPGHTPGHISMLHEAASLLLIGDLVGSMDGRLTLGPPQFTANPAGRDASLARVLGLDVDRILFSHGAEIAEPRAAIREILIRPKTSPA